MIQKITYFISGFAVLLVILVITSTVMQVEYWASRSKVSEDDTHYLMG